MNLDFAPKPFSIFELVAGGAALAPVALIAFFGLRVQQSQNPLPAAPASLSAAAIPLSRSSVPASSEQSGERSQRAGAVGKRSPVDPGSEGDAPTLAEADSANVTGSPAVDHPLIAAAWRLGRWQFADAAGVERRLIKAGLLWGFADRAGEPESRAAWCGFPSPNAAGLPEVWDRRVQPNPFAMSCDRSSAESRTGPVAPERVAEAGIVPPPPPEQNPPQRDSSGENTFVGGWADDSGECRQYQNHGAPLVISAHVAKTAGGQCDFRSVSQEAASRWRIVALCSREGKSWTAHVDLKLAGSNLIWSSERGTAKYVRCLRS